jgi:hypothetical protein
VKLATPFGTKEMTIEQLVPGDILTECISNLPSHLIERVESGLRLVLAL